MLSSIYKSKRGKISLLMARSKYKITANFNLLKFKGSNIKAPLMTVFNLYQRGITPVMFYAAGDQNF